MHLRHPVEASLPDLHLRASIFELFSNYFHRELATQSLIDASLKEPHPQAPILHVQIVHLGGLLIGVAFVIDWCCFCY